MTVNDPYEAIENIGELYDSVPLYQSRSDIAFYVEEAQNAKGRVLEIGCGTGRVLIPAARNGVEITGMDRSSRMLSRCRERVDAEPAEVRARVTLQLDDMRSFDLGRTYALAIVPFRPMQHLITIDDQLSALNSIRRHLEPRGQLIFDVFNLNLRLVADPAAAEEREDMPETSLPDGRKIRRTSRVNAVHTIEQYSEVDLIYYVQYPDGRSERLVHSITMRWYMKAELDHLLARGGFRVVDTYGNFDRSPVSDGLPELIFVAERA